MFSKHQCLSPCISEERGVLEKSIRNYVDGKVESHRRTGNLLCVCVGVLSWSGCGAQGDYLPFPKQEFHHCFTGGIRSCLCDRHQLQHSRANCFWRCSSNTNIIWFSKTSSQQSRMLAIYEQVMVQRPVCHKRSSFVITEMLFVS